MEKKKNNLFKVGDWIITTEIQLFNGQKSTNAHVVKVKKNGALLDVLYGSWSKLATIHAKNCKLLKRGN